MKANQKSLLANDTRAQVGIGTMIVFIATILVAATAAAVLIDTSGKLQERSSSTGTETTKQVASNLVLKHSIGLANAGGDKITSANFTVTLAPGASKVDLSQLKIRVSDGSNLNTYAESSNLGTSQAAFSLTWGTGSGTVMTAGDLAHIEVDFDDADADKLNEVAVRTSVDVLFIPEVGSHMDATFTTPNSVSANEYYVLR